MLQLFKFYVINYTKVNLHIHIILNRYDIAGGALLGGSFAVWTCHILSRKFNVSKTETVTQSKSSSTNNNRCAGEQRLLATPIIAKEEFTMNNLE